VASHKIAAMSVHRTQMSPDAWFFVLPLASRLRSPQSSGPRRRGRRRDPAPGLGPLHFTDLAAQLRLPAYGPLTLPGDWTLA
jgi:hypothetical protein